MKSKFSLIAALLAFAFVSTTATAEAEWRNYPVVMERAEQLAEAVELLDESLHSINASEQVIEVIHHFEETVLAALEEFPELSYEDARVELDHLREDIFLTYDTLDRADFFNSVEAIDAWNNVLMTYISLERSLDYP